MAEKRWVDEQYTYLNISFGFSKLCIVIAQEQNSLILLERKTKFAQPTISKAFFQVHFTVLRFLTRLISWILLFPINGYCTKESNGISNTH